MFLHKKAFHILQTSFSVSVFVYYFKRLFYIYEISYAVVCIMHNILY